MVVARLREWIEGMSSDNDVTTLLRLVPKVARRDTEVDDNNDTLGANNSWGDVISLHTPLPGATPRRGPVPTTPLPRVNPSPTPFQPHRVGSYMLHEEIAHGGMASVHLGRSTAGPQRLVAIKQLDPAVAARPGAMTMFLDEGRLLARVRHPNVVPIVDMVVNPIVGELSLVMEYVHGVTLAHLLGAEGRKGSPPPVAIAAGIMVGVLRGLHAAHEATNHDGRPLEIVHCDISPQNIMVGADGVARIIDFGVARSILQSRRDVDSSEEFAERPRGKRSYLSPEQIRGKSLDRRSDLFSSAIVLWELLAGRRLFQGPSRRAVWMQILLGQSAPPSSLNPEVSRELDDAVLCALDCDRERRFPTAEAFADRLAEVTSAAGPAELRAWVQKIAGQSLLQQAERAAEIVGGAPTTAPPGERHRVGRAMFRHLGRMRGFAVMGGLVMLLAVMLQIGGPTAGRAISKTNGPGAAPATGRASSFVVENMPEQQGNSRASMPLPMPELVASPPSEALSSPASPALSLADPPPLPAEDAKQSPQRHRVTRKSTPAVRAIEDLNRKAFRAYRLRDYAAARKMVYTALAMCGANRLDLTPQAALAQAQLAAILVRGFNQHDLAVDRFRTALRIDRHVPLAPLLKDPRVAAVFRLAAA